MLSLSTSLRRQSRSGILRTLLACALILAGMPTITAVIVVDSKPAFTLDICHPLQSIDRTSGASTIALPSSQPPAQALAQNGVATDPAVVRRIRPSDKPDPPPPKIGA
jgi:hypothetical protein